VRLSFLTINYEDLLPSGEKQTLKYVTPNLQVNLQGLTSSLWNSNRNPASVDITPHVYHNRWCVFLLASFTGLLPGSGHLQYHHHKLRRRRSGIETGGAAAVSCVHVFTVMQLTDPLSNTPTVCGGLDTQ